jgi:hypothetical protein
MPFSDADIIFVHFYGERDKENDNNTDENSESIKLENRTEKVIRSYKQYEFQ